MYSYLFIFIYFFVFFNCSSSEFLSQMYLECLLEYDHSAAIIPGAKCFHDRFIKLFDKNWYRSSWEKTGETGTDQFVVLVRSTEKALITNKLRDRPYVSFGEFSRVIVQNCLRWLCARNKNMRLPKDVCPEAVPVPVPLIQDAFVSKNKNLIPSRKKIKSVYF